jgi:hypothetical protein
VCHAHPTELFRSHLRISHCPCVVSKAVRLVPLTHSSRAQSRRVCTAHHCYVATRIRRLGPATQRRTYFLERLKRNYRALRVTPTHLTLSLCRIQCGSLRAPTHLLRVWPRQLPVCIMAAIELEYNQNRQVKRKMQISRPSATPCFVPIRVHPRSSAVPLLLLQTRFLAMAAMPINPTGLGEGGLGPPSPFRCIYNDAGYFASNSASITSSPPLRLTSPSWGGAWGPGAACPAAAACFLAASS